jgi:hypothetical protein
LIKSKNKLLNPIIILLFLKNKYHFLEFNINFLSIYTLIIILLIVLITFLYELFIKIINQL